MFDRAVDVYVQIVGHDFHAGSLSFHQRRGAESATFAYEPGTSTAQGAYAIDPALPLVSGPLQTPVGQRIFGAFSDCAPESWGRKLTERARPGDGPVSEAEHLLGVRDDLRQGSLRFRDPETGAFLSEVSDAAPELTDLPRLLSYSDRVDRDGATRGSARGAPEGRRVPRRRPSEGPRRRSERPARDRQVSEAGRRGVGRRGLGGGRARARPSRTAERRRRQPPHGSTAVGR